MHVNSRLDRHIEEQKSVKNLMDYYIERAGLQSKESEKEQRDWYDKWPKFD